MMGKRSNEGCEAEKREDCEGCEDCNGEGCEGYGGNCAAYSEAYIILCVTQLTKYMCFYTFVLDSVWIYIHL